MVQEIHQVLMDREDTCHRTCFSLQLDGNVLDNFAELKSIEGLQEGSLLKVVEGEGRTLSFTRFSCSVEAKRDNKSNMLQLTSSLTLWKGQAVITLLEHFLPD